MSCVANFLRNAWTRYDHPEAFEYPDDIFVTGKPYSLEEMDGEMWIVKTFSTRTITDENKHTETYREISTLSKGSYILEECGRSTSGYVLMVLINSHNTIMSSKETKSTKIANVILLDLEAMIVCPFAIVETIMRCVLLLPSLCCGKTLEDGLHSIGRTSRQIPNALVAPIQFTTSQRTVQPWL